MEQLNCQDILAVMSGLLDGELDRETRHLAERHLVTCPACRDRLQKAEDADALIREAALTYEAAWTDDVQARLFAAVTASGPVASLSATGVRSASAVALPTTLAATGTRRLRVAAWSGWSVAAAAVVVTGITLVGSGRLGLGGAEIDGGGGMGGAIASNASNTSDDRGTATRSGMPEDGSSDATGRSGGTRSDLGNGARSEPQPAPEGPEITDSVTFLAHDGGRSADGSTGGAIAPDLIIDGLPHRAVDRLIDDRSGLAVASNTSGSPAGSGGSAAPWWTNAIWQLTAAQGDARRTVRNAGEWLLDELSTGLGGAEAMGATVAPAPYDLGLSGLGPKDLALAEALFRQTSYPEDVASALPRSRPDEAPRFERFLGGDPGRLAASSEGRAAASRGADRSGGLEVERPTAAAVWVDLSANPIQPADHVYSASVLLSLIAEADADSMEDLQQVYRVLTVDRELLSGLTATRQQLASGDAEARRTLDQAWTVLESVHASVDQRWLRQTQQFIASNHLPERLEAISVAQSRR